MTTDERATLAAVENYDAQRKDLAGAAHEWDAIDPQEAERFRAAIRLLARARAAELRNPEPSAYDWRDSLLPRRQDEP